MGERTEWGVERTLGDVGSVINFEGSRVGAESCAAKIGGIVVRRVVTYSDWERAGDLSDAGGRVEP